MPGKSWAEYGEKRCLVKAGQYRARDNGLLLTAVILRSSKRFPTAVNSLAAGAYNHRRPFYLRCGC